MKKLLDDLKGNTHRFAVFCIEQYVLDEIVQYAKKGIDRDACQQWEITEEQWQNALFAVLETLRFTKTN